MGMLTSRDMALVPSKLLLSKHAHLFLRQAGEEEAHVARDAPRQLAQALLNLSLRVPAKCELHDLVGPKAEPEWH